MPRDHKSWAEKLTIGRLVALEGLYIKRMSEPAERAIPTQAAASRSRKSASSNESLRANAELSLRDDVKEGAKFSGVKSAKRDFVALVR